MIQLDFVIDPVAKGRPRFGKRSVYTPKKTENFENSIKKMAIDQYHKKPKVEPLGVIIDFYIKRPKSVSVKKRPYPVVKPDLDNLTKSLLDSLNGVLYKDDSQIIEIKVSKRYSDIGSIGLKLYVIK